jgi:hypothetical protein
MKLHELAKELNTKATELLKKATELNMEIKSVNAHVSLEDEQTLRNEFGIVVSGGSLITPIAFVRRLGLDANNMMRYELVEAEICENGFVEIKSRKEFNSRTRAFHELGYKNGHLEMDV